MGEKVKREFSGLKTQAERHIAGFSSPKFNFVIVSEKRGPFSTYFFVEELFLLRQEKRKRGGGILKRLLFFSGG